MAERRRTPMLNPSASPPTAPATTRRRRRQLLPLSSSPTFSSHTVRMSPTSSSSSALSSISSDPSFLLSSFSPAPSPFHHHFFLSPLRTSAVPFSWEHRPGIPKTPMRQQAACASAKAKTALPPQPLPPSLLSTKVGAADGYFIVPVDAKVRRQRQHRQRPPALVATLTDWLAVFSLYKSCTRSHDCLASASPLRPHVPTKASRLIH